MLLTRTVIAAFVALFGIAAVSFSAFAEEPPVGPSDVIRLFTDLVEKEAQGVDYLEPEDVERIRLGALDIFPLEPTVPAKEAARKDREGEMAFLAEELRKEFPLSDAEFRQAAEKEAEALFPLYERGDQAAVTYRFGKYSAKGVYYGKRGDYLLIGETTVPIPDLPEEELRKFDAQKTRQARDAFIQKKCGEYAEKKRIAARDMRERWVSGREERRFKLGFLRYAQKWYTGERLLDELVRRKNLDLLQNVREKAARTAASGDFPGARKILQDFLARHPALTPELKDVMEELARAESEARSRTERKEAKKMTDPEQARKDVEKMVAQWQELKIIEA